MRGIGGVSANGRWQPSTSDLLWSFRRVALFQGIAYRRAFLAAAYSSPEKSPVHRSSLRKSSRSFSVSLLKLREPSFISSSGIRPWSVIFSCMRSGVSFNREGLVELVYPFRCACEYCFALLEQGFEVLLVHDPGRVSQQDHVEG